MSANLKLQRLAYPFQEPSIKPSEFGPSIEKFTAIRGFFTCAVMGNPRFPNGEIQEVLDDFFANRKKVVGHAVDVHFHFAGACINSTQTPPLNSTRPLFVLGPKDRIGSFEKTLIAISKTHQEDSPHIIPGLREFMAAEFLSQSKNYDKTDQSGTLATSPTTYILNNTMGWLDLESGCFAMRSMNAMNRVRELFGMRPHVAMKKQRHNYPSTNAEPILNPQ